MDKREIFVKMTLMEEKVGQLYREIGELKDVIVALMEENAQLLVENEHLRKRLHEKPGEPPSPETAKNAGQGQAAKNKRKFVGEAYDNLARLYAEGFHICNVHYGSLRKEGDCLFCLSFLSGAVHK
ncbi:DNA replication initiation control protein YabA [Brevibacillus sp. SYP-B805]|uniref:DNA replication initiation control protein YabA n=1 Tax=Brevibacillus sp. SYP-B805 TaxID=1578199 RepID=UPI0013ECED28|nr:DNA replication initiation control protein YabA [Brevibacillus sp. SYP-B805]